MGNIITSEEDISHEEEQNSEILVADGYDDHAPVINIYELLMNNEFMEIQTDRDDWIIYLLSQHDIHVYVIYAYAKRWRILFAWKAGFYFFFVLCSICSMSWGGRGSMILNGIRQGEGVQENTNLRGTSKMYGL